MTRRRTEQVLALPIARKMSIAIKKDVGVPSEIVLDCNVLPLYTYEAVALDKKKARQYATTLRDKIGGFAQHVPPLPLAGPIDATIMWLLLTQCAVCSYAGFNLTPQSFGAPPGYGQMESRQWQTGHGAPPPQQQQPAYSLETPYATLDDIGASAKQVPQRRPLAIVPGM